MKRRRNPIEDLVMMGQDFVLNLGDAVWWRYPLAWKTSLALYGLVSFTIAGTVLGKFIRPENVC